MSTYGAMQDRIADEMSRSDIASNIQNSIKDAIEHWSEERFYFNEDRSLTFTTSDGQEFYTVADNASIPLYSEVDTVRITINSNRNYPLLARTYQEIDDWQSNDNFKSQPTDYCRYNQGFRLYPIPNGAYEIRVSGTAVLATLSATTDTNFWMVEGEQLIRAHAKWDLYHNVLRNYDEAQSQLQTETRAMNSLLKKTTNRAASGRLKKTTF